MQQLKKYTEQNCKPANPGPEITMAYSYGLNRQIIYRHPKKRCHCQDVEQHNSAWEPSARAIKHGKWVDYPTRALLLRLSLMMTSCTGMHVVRFLRPMFARVPGTHRSAISAKLIEYPNGSKIGSKLVQSTGRATNRDKSKMTVWPTARMLLRQACKHFCEV